MNKLHLLKLGNISEVVKDEPGALSKINQSCQWITEQNVILQEHHQHIKALLNARMSRTEKTIFSHKSKSSSMKRQVWPLLITFRNVFIWKWRLTLMLVKIFWDLLALLLAKSIFKKTQKLPPNLKLYL